MPTLDYAQLFETEIRPRRRLAARAVLAGLFLVRPRLALALWRDRDFT